MTDRQRYVSQFELSEQAAADQLHREMARRRTVDQWHAAIKRDGLTVVRGPEVMWLEPVRDEQGRIIVVHADDGTETPPRWMWRAVGVVE